VATIDTSSGASIAACLAMLRAQPVTFGKRPNIVRLRLRGGCCPALPPGAVGVLVPLLKAATGVV